MSTSASTFAGEKVSLPTINEVKTWNLPLHIPIVASNEGIYASDASLVTQREKPSPGLIQMIQRNHIVPIRSPAIYFGDAKDDYSFEVYVKEKSGKTWNELLNSKSSTVVFFDEDASDLPTLATPVKLTLKHIVTMHSRKEGNEEIIGLQLFDEEFEEMMDKITSILELQSKVSQRLKLSRLRNTMNCDTGDTLLERQFQMEIYVTILSLLPAIYFISPNGGKKLCSDGFVDFHINGIDGDLSWFIKLLVEGHDAKRHFERF
ncbi:9612_t:CDS:2 [Ambispora leptoticha]|uniref:9612_t:CDS:1 n=1 Tax=Ambispora leptoticha TaxID=144679 RepID=A0A9N8YY60_9GLOM|nr:9612_t:CDS:2 [Ambispora leptoticha]